MLSDTYVSAGSVTSYATKSGKRWRWQAVAAIQSGNVKSKTAPVGEAGFHTRREAEQARDEARHQLRKHGFSPKEPLEVIPTVKEIGEMMLVGDFHALFLLIGILSLPLAAIFGRKRG